MKAKLIITLTISYQFETISTDFDPEFYRGSRGMVFKYFSKTMLFKKCRFSKHQTKSEIYYYI